MYTFSSLLYTPISYDIYMFLLIFIPWYWNENYNNVMACSICLSEQGIINVKIFFKSFSPVLFFEISFVLKNYVLPPHLLPLNFKVQISKNQLLNFSWYIATCLFTKIMIGPRGYGQARVFCISFWKYIFIECSILWQILQSINMQCIFNFITKVGFFFIHIFVTIVILLFLLQAIWM